jgi:V8-like Glu-specific endopeptidase
MIFFKSLIQLVIMLGLASCGKKEHFTYPPDPLKPLVSIPEVKKDENELDKSRTTYGVWQETHTPDTEDTQSSYLTFFKEFGEIRFECPEQGCHPSVGLVFSMGGRCEATLIAEDEILTANHCIQQVINTPSLQVFLYLSNIASACEQVSFYLPATKDYPAEYAGCRNLRGSDNGDFSIIKLNKKISRPFVTLSSESDSKVKTAVMINKVQNNVYKEEFVPCEEGRQDSPLHALKAIKSFHKCKVILGNSGGPLLNNDGTLWGIISGFEPTWNMNVAGSAYCVQAFRDNPLASLEQCWNMSRDVNDFIVKNVKDLPPIKETEFYVTEYRRAIMIGTSPKCLPELQGKLEIIFESTVCDYFYDQRKKVQAAENCTPGTASFNILSDFGSFYRAYLFLEVKDLNAKTSPRDALYVFISKCKETK